MADQKVSALTEVSVPALGDILYLVDDPGGTPTAAKLSAQRLLGLLALNSMRLTTESAVPVSASDRASQATLYLTPRLTGAASGLVTLFDGTRPILKSIGEISLSLTGLLTNAKPHDLFLDVDGATLSVLAWTSDTARAGALAAEGPLLVRASDHTKTYLGTCYASGTGTIEDTLAKRWLWNAYNRVPRAMQAATETTDSWNYSTAAFRQANATVANQLDYVVGLAEDMIEAHAIALAKSSAGTLDAAVGIGLDGTTNAAQIFGASVVNTLIAQLHATYRGIPGIGRHAVLRLESGNTSATVTWYGDAGVPTLYRSGITGTVWA